MTWSLLAIVIAMTVLSDMLQSYQMKRTRPNRGYLVLSIVCLAISFFAFMALVQRAPLSFAVPASAGSFVVETVLAKFALHENIGPRRAAGAILVLGGVILLAQ